MSQLIPWYNFNEALCYSESRLVGDALGLLNSIIPDNEELDSDDAANWERVYGMNSNPDGS